MNSRRFRVLVLCTGNSARSILGEYLLRHLNPARFETASAGADPKGSVHPMALAVLRESYGIEASDAWSKRTDQLTGGDFDLVLTVCDHARDACPIWPGASAVVHWGLSDPAAVEGPESAVREAFEAVAAELDRRFRRLVTLPLETQSRDERMRAVAALAEAS
jgi:arsenate reductase (thioredoxin)